MRILYVAMKYDYGRPSQGPSFEHYNFYHSLVHMGHDIIYFDFMSLLQEHGRAWMNNRLLEVARAENPALMFTVLFSDEFDPSVLRELTEGIGIETINWFCDDHWRFEQYSRLWAPCFRWVVTTAESALPKYAQMGYCNVIKSQWACNPFLYRRINTSLEYDVTFIGQPYGNRPKIIERLKREGIDVKAWGTGWDSGRVSQADMIRIFNQSRINLNLTGTYGNSLPSGRISSAAGNSITSRLLDRIPFVRAMKNTGKVLNLNQRASSSASDHAEPVGEPTEQIKGRNFEVPGCGGFLLTGNADNLSEYYDIGKEVVCFHDIDDMVQKIRYYLKHEDERAAIAQAGYEKTLCAHTYERRFAEIFQRMGISRGVNCRLTDQRSQVGSVVEVR